MERYWIELACRVKPGRGDFEEHVLGLMDALMDEPGAVDPDLAVELEGGRMVISMGVDAETDRVALEQALLYARSAIHRTGGHTPDWGKSPDAEQFVIADGFDARVRPANAIC
jgi:hypothetical protein